jgi:hypothetical protein
VINVKPREQYKNSGTLSSVRWAARNEAKAREYKAAYKKRNAGKIRELEWERDCRRVRERMVISARSRAKKLGIAFEITADDLLMSATCPVLGEPFHRVPGHRNLMAPSIDRIDPSLGYVPGNVQVMSRLANMMKNCATPAQLRAFAARVASTQQTQGD